MSLDWKPRADTQEVSVVRAKQRIIIHSLRSQLGTATTSEANCAAISQSQKNSHSICTQECSSAEVIRCSRDLALLRVQKLSLMETIWKVERQNIEHEIRKIQISLSK